MNRGYVKLWRKTIDSRVFANADLLKIWVWCLCKATHRREIVPILTGRGATDVEIEPGQFIFGRKSAASELNMNDRTIYDRMKKLACIKNIVIKSNTHYSLVTICKWEDYQSPEFGTQHPTQQPSNNHPTTIQHIQEQKAQKEVILKPLCANSDESAPKTTPKKQTLYTKDFETFWQAYPRKTGKGAAWNSWRRLNGSRPDDMEIILNAIDQQRRTEQWNRDGGQYIPLPATWLNQRRWEDEPESAKQMSLDLIRAELEERKRGI